MPGNNFIPCYTDEQLEALRARARWLRSCNYSLQASFDRARDDFIHGGDTNMCIVIYPNGETIMVNLRHPPRSPIRVSSTFAEYARSVKDEINPPFLQRPPR